MSILRSPTNLFCTQVAIAGQDQVERDVDRRDHDHGRDVVVEPDVDLLAHERQAGRCHGVPEAGVLQGHHALADDRGDHDLHRLRQLDDHHHLALPHAHGVRRLRLAGWDSQDAGPEDLGEHGSVVDGQREHHAPVGAGVTAVDAVLVVEEHHQQQHRHGAEELHEGPAGPAHEAMVGELADAEDDPDHDRTDDRAERHLQGVQHAVDKDHLVVAGRDEDLPHVVLELALISEPLHDETDDGDEYDNRDDGVDPVARDRARPRAVEQDAGAHSGSPRNRERSERLPVVCVGVFMRSASDARAGSHRTRRSRRGTRRSARTR